MTCSYCGGRNNEDESRCRRCGRKPGDSLNGGVTLSRTHGALAAQLQPVLSMQAAEGPIVLTGSARQTPHAGRPAVQGSLFWERPEGKIIPFDSFQLAPSAPMARPRPKAAPAAKTAARTQARRIVRVPEEQGSLDFLPPAPATPRTLGTTVEAVIYCEDPVATRLHRAVAAAFDWSMVLIAYGLFLLMFRLCGGQFILNSTNLTLFGAVLPVLGCIYGLLWALTCNETAGMRWANLRLTTFDGFPPERSQRMLRFAGSCLSLCAVVGLLWSFADEESLAWSDHISRTFPTPRRVDSEVFRRR